MHPQILRTWSQRRKALAIRAPNLFQNNGKRNLFPQNWSDNDAKKKRLQDFYDNFICTCRRHEMTKTMEGRKGHNSVLLF